MMHYHALLPLTHCAVAPPPTVGCLTGHRHPTCSTSLFVCIWLYVKITFNSFIHCIHVEHPPWSNSLWIFSCSAFYWFFLTVWLIFRLFDCLWATLFIALVTHSNGFVFISSDKIFVKVTLCQSPSLSVFSPILYTGVNLRW